LKCFYPFNEGAVLRNFGGWTGSGGGIGQGAGQRAEERGEVSKFEEA